MKLKKFTSLTFYNYSIPRIQRTPDRVFIFLITDLNVDVNQIGPQQAHEINLCGTSFGLIGNDFYSLLTRDLEEQEALRLAREHEEEKAMYSVRSCQTNSSSYTLAVIFI